MIKATAQNPKPKKIKKQNLKQNGWGKSGLLGWQW
jgi:hypothetical protein